MQKYRCIDQNCSNYNNYCYFDTRQPRQHFNITAPQHESWANSISSGQATSEQPPAQPLDYWQSVQGTITRESRQPIKHTAMQQLKSTTDQILEMQMRMQEQKSL